MVLLKVKFVSVNQSFTFATSVNQYAGTHNQPHYLPLCQNSLHYVPMLLFQCRKMTHYLTIAYQIENYLTSVFHLPIALIFIA
jgi:hypothetical protein